MSDKIYFFIDIDKIANNVFTLDVKESHHFIHVLRKKIGTEIWLTDGVGCSYLAAVQEIQGAFVSGKILNRYPNYGENKIQINLGIGILKKDKMNFVVEKATECGVNKIIPLILDTCIRRDVNLEKLRNIAKSAVKQCGRSVIPNIYQPSKLRDIINDNYILLVCQQTGEKIMDIMPIEAGNNSQFLLIVGPEGDFSNKEIDLLNEHNARFIGLGNRRLRSETAVITALAQLNIFLN